MCARPGRAGSGAAEHGLHAHHRAGGRTGLARRDHRRQLVAAGAASPALTTVVSVSPVYASFELDEQSYLRYTAPGAGGSQPNLPIYLGWLTRTAIRTGAASSRSTTASIRAAAPSACGRCSTTTTAACCRASMPASSSAAPRPIPRCWSMTAPSVPTGQEVRAGGGPRQQADLPRSGTRTGLRRPARDPQGPGGGRDHRRQRAAAGAPGDWWRPSRSTWPSSARWSRVRSRPTASRPRPGPTMASR